MIRKSVTTTATNLTTAYSVNNIKTYIVYNISSVTAYVTDEEITTGGNITSLNNYWTIPANGFKIFTTGTPYGLWGQAASSTAIIEVSEL